MKVSCIVFRYKIDENCESPWSCNAGLKKTVQDFQCPGKFNIYTPQCFQRLAANDAINYFEN